MKKGWSLAIFLLVGMLQLVFITPDYTRANGQSNPSFTGTYLVQIKTSSGDDYSAKIGIEDLGDDKIKLSGNFDGMPLTAIGKRSEEKSDTSGYIFKTNIPKLYNGTAVMDLRYEDNQYKLSGSGKGTYQYQGFSGQSSFKITGHRTSPSLPTFGAASFPALLTAGLKTAASHPLASGASLFALILIIFLWIRQGRRYTHPE